MKATYFSLAVIIFLISADSFSQSRENKYARQGTWETGGNFYFTSTAEEYSINDGTYAISSKHEHTNFSTLVNAGCFVINGLKLGADAGMEADDIWGHTHTYVKLYFTPEYVFRTGTIAFPYAGVSVGYSSKLTQLNFTHEGFSWGIKTGTKINIAGNSLLDIGLRYYEQKYTYESVSSDRREETHKQFGVSAGWSVFF